MNLVYIIYEIMDTLKVFDRFNKQQKCMKYIPKVYSIHYTLRYLRELRS